MDANASIDHVMLDVCLPLAWLAAVAFAGCLAAAALEALWVALTGASPWSWSPAPRALRRLGFAACGLSLVAAFPVPAGAVASDTPGQPCPRPCVGLDGLPLPDLPVSQPGGRIEPSRHRFVVVRPGDCLWTLATDLTGADAPAADVASAVDALYRLNRARIGADPDLIFPGTRLTAPEVLR